MRGALAAAALFSLATLASAQRMPWANREPEIKNVAYDGRFTFARLKFTNPPAGYYYQGLPAWAHGYPKAERNMMQILEAITTLAPHVDEINVFAMDDPELFKYPVAFMTEAGWWTLTDAEAVSLRAYLKKGGFVLTDDSRDDFFRGGGGWQNFENNMRKVLPEARLLDVPVTHPVFHSFFEIDSLDIIPQFYDRGAPVFKAVFEDNDPTKRIMMMVNFNTDISNFWEFSATGFKPAGENNEAYKLGVNYLMYAMTH